MAEETVNSEASEASGDAAAAASITEYPRHQPFISQRKPGSTSALLRRWRDLGAIWLGHRLDPIFREEIMLSVADANTCRQCSFAHREWALAEGLSDAELAALEGLNPEYFDGRKLAALYWVHAYASTDFTSVPDVIDANFRQHYDAQEQSDIELVARTMYWMNETSNGMDALWYRIKGKPVPGGHVGKELMAALVYVLLVPPLLIYLAIRRRHRLIAELRAIPKFFVSFEERQRKNFLNRSRANNQPLTPPAGAGEAQQVLASDKPT